MINTKLDEPLDPPCPDSRIDGAIDEAERAANEHIGYALESLQEAEHEYNATMTRWGFSGLEDYDLICMIKQLEKRHTKETGE